ncbi:MAG: winged helix-turn-helix domain-containing protein, partial [Afipia sp.]|nr:winged helix-turn-helix domain-containing protein [Afipia sp.]
MQYGFDFSLWTQNAVRKLIFQKLGISLSASSIGNLLAE